MLGNAFIVPCEANRRRLRLRCPADTEAGADNEPPRPGHGEQLPGHPAGAGRLLTGSGGRRSPRPTPIGAFASTARCHQGIDQHIAAVALFGNGSQWAGPITNLNPTYNDRTIELCRAGPICNPADPNTWKQNWPQHLAGAYIDAGMANQAADFVTSKL